MSLASSKFEIKEYGEDINILEVTSFHHIYKAILRDFFVENKPQFREEFPYISSIHIDARHHIDLKEEN
jgi:hypothetical protein